MSNEAKSKQKLGQFYTTNYEYILKNLHIPKSISHAIEPFAGQGDLLPFIQSFSHVKNTEYYDIEPKSDLITQRDTLLNPPDYSNKFILTNPPYLARNKSKSKEIFDKYNQNDLYKCLISQLSDQKCSGGILIIPLNFWCSIRLADINLRKKFLSKYNITTINIFEEKVFDDTSYTICSFQFQPFKKSFKKLINCYLYPKNKKIDFKLSHTNNFTIGGEIYLLPQQKHIKVERLTSKNKQSEFRTNILVKCIDDSEKNKINLSIVNDKNIFIDETPKLSARSYATLVIEPLLSDEEQKTLVDNFNLYLNEQREKYDSLFLTNYRESNTIARKRISFKLVFEIVNYLLSQDIITLD